MNAPIRIINDAQAEKLERDYYNSRPLKSGYYKHKDHNHWNLYVVFFNTFRKYTFESQSLADAFILQKIYHSSKKLDDLK